MLNKYLFPTTKKERMAIYGMASRDHRTYRAGHDRALPATVLLEKRVGGLGYDSRNLGCEFRSRHKCRYRDQGGRGRAGDSRSRLYARTDAESGTHVRRDAGSNADTKSDSRAHIDAKFNSDAFCVSESDDRINSDAVSDAHCNASADSGTRTAYTQSCAHTNGYSYVGADADGTASDLFDYHNQPVRTDLQRSGFELAILHDGGGCGFLERQRHEVL